MVWSTKVDAFNGCKTEYSILVLLTLIFYLYFICDDKFMIKILSMFMAENGYTIILKFPYVNI